jgi:CHAT domain-containing protein
VEFGVVNRNRLQYLILASASALVWIYCSPLAFAATHEQIVEMCRQTMHPEIHACVQSKKGSGDLDAIRKQCHQAFIPACVRREEQKQAARTPAPQAPTSGVAEPAPDIATGVKPMFVAPPRTIADITAILDSEKPDQAAIAARKAAADAKPPDNASPAQLAQFYYDRAAARSFLGRTEEALADGLQAIALGKDKIEYGRLWRIQQFVAIQYRVLGDPKQSIASFEALARQGDQSGHRGGMINAMANVVRTLLSIGDLNQADAYVKRVEALVQEARGSPNPSWRQSYSIYGHSWEADASAARAMVFQARGQYADAEASFRRAEAFQRAILKDLTKYEFPPPAQQVQRGVDSYRSAIAQNEASQERLSEAEADARSALLAILKEEGKYSSQTPGFIVGLASILIEQGRYPEAEKLARSALEIQRTLGVRDDAPQSAKILSQLGGILVAERKAREAAAVYAQLEKAIAQWPPQQREIFELNGARILALYASGQIEAGIAAAEQWVKRKVARTGANSYETAVARGTLAGGYARAGRDTDALREFKMAIPVLIGGTGETDEDDPTLLARRSARLQRSIESYISVLARNPTLSNNVAAETFELADLIRGHAVEKALADASARMVATDSALAALVRTEQDAAKQISAQLGALNNLLALPSDQRDDKTVRAINATIEGLRTDRKTAQQEIKRRFPAYSDLIDPKPPTVDQIKATLRPGEALLSFYFGQDASFVWAVPKEGPAAFAIVPSTASELEAKVRRLRQALEPNVATVSDIPPFDLTLAYELYTTLLKPVEAGWQGAKSLIVVTNGALGELPLAVLPTEPAQVDLQAKPLFSGYRNVPWLARNHAVTVLPSTSALVTLRRLPAGASDREKLIGFGDPYFNAVEAAEAEQEQSAAPMQVAAVTDTGGAAVMTRGIALNLRASPHTEDLNVAELATLPRLPDTRLELLAVANALAVDPNKALYFGKAANEQNVETINLAHYRIVAFATHGLVPGDLDGLTQPALALTAPDIAGINGDGLLTMEKILALKLDADWVVLSACNTAAGAGAGAEAVSGLGSAFFYAGTRALLVTNWSVHSASARELITDIFRRQSSDPNLSNAEALRQAMTAMIDGGVFKDASGQAEFSYAHPLFWAPYSIIGDGGVTR